MRSGWLARTASTQNVTRESVTEGKRELKDPVEHVSSCWRNRIAQTTYGEGKVFTASFHTRPFDKYEDEEAK